MNSVLNNIYATALKNQNMVFSYDETHLQSSGKDNNTEKVDGSKPLEERKIVQLKGENDKTDGQFRIDLYKSLTSSHTFTNEYLTHLRNELGLDDDGKTTIAEKTLKGSDIKQIIDSARKVVETDAVNQIDKLFNVQAMDLKAKTALTNYAKLNTDKPEVKAFFESASSTSPADRFKALSKLVGSYIASSTPQEGGGLTIAYCQGVMAGVELLFGQDEDVSHNDKSESVLNPEAARWVDANLDNFSSEDSDTVNPKVEGNDAAVIGGLSKIAENNVDLKNRFPEGKVNEAFNKHWKGFAQELKNNDGLRKELTKLYNDSCCPNENTANPPKDKVNEVYIRQFAEFVRQNEELNKTHESQDSKKEQLTVKDSWIEENVQKFSVRDSDERDALKEIARGNEEARSLFPEGKVDDAFDKHWDDFVNQLKGSQRVRRALSAVYDNSHGSILLTENRQCDMVNAVFIKKFAEFVKSRPANFTEFKEDKLLELNNARGGTSVLLPDEIGELDGEKVYLQSLGSNRCQTLAVLNALNGSKFVDKMRQSLVLHDVSGSPYYEFYNPQNTSEKVQITQAELDNFDKDNQQGVKLSKFEKLLLVALKKSASDTLSSGLNPVAELPPVANLLGFDCETFGRTGQVQGLSEKELNADDKLAFLNKVQQHLNQQGGKGPCALRTTTPADHFRAVEKTYYNDENDFGVICKESMPGNSSYVKVNLAAMSDFQFFNIVELKSPEKVHVLPQEWEYVTHNESPISGVNAGGKSATEILDEQESEIKNTPCIRDYEKLIKSFKPSKGKEQDFARYTKLVCVQVKYMLDGAFDPKDIKLEGVLSALGVAPLVEQGYGTMDVGPVNGEEVEAKAQKSDESQEMTVAYDSAWSKLKLPNDYEYQRLKSWSQLSLVMSNLDAKNDIGNEVLVFLGNFVEAIQKLSETISMEEMAKMPVSEIAEQSQLKVPEKVNNAIAEVEAKE